MSAEVIALLRPSGGRFLVDATLGDGGHAWHWLSAGGSVIGIDKDPNAIERARHRLERFGDRLRLVHDSFAEMARFVSERIWGVLFDLGTSRLQIESPDRGFSYLEDGPLDMRMNPTTGLPARLMLQQMDESALAQALHELGDISRSRRVARAILRAGPPKTTQELVRAVEGCFPRERRIKDLARVFQTLRILVNREYQDLVQGLSSAVDLLMPGGRLAILTYHSGEARIARSFLKRESGTCTCPAGLPVCSCGARARLRPLLRGQSATAKEIEANSRARSARLWAGERIDA